jgi:hypothetical protein
MMKQVTTLCAKYDKTLASVEGHHSAASDAATIFQAQLSAAKAEAEREAGARRQEEEAAAAAATMAAAAADAARLAAEQARSEALAKEQQALHELAEAKREERRRQQQMEADAAAAQLAEEEEAKAALGARLDAVPVTVEGLHSSLAVLKSGNASDGYLTAVRVMHLFTASIMSKPEEEQWRRIKFGHPKFQAEVGAKVGGLECLAALGFRLVPNAVTGDVLFMAEPDVEVDMDAWSDWGDHVAACRGILDKECAWGSNAGWGRWAATYWDGWKKE